MPGRAVNFEELLGELHGLLGREVAVTVEIVRFVQGGAPWDPTATDFRRVLDVKGTLSRADEDTTQRDVFAVIVGDAEVYLSGDWVVMAGWFDDMSALPGDARLGVLSGNGVFVTFRPLTDDLFPD